jgi:hypothetical protein
MQNDEYAKETLLHDIGVRMNYHCASSFIRQRNRLALFWVARRGK